MPLTTTPTLSQLLRIANKSFVDEIHTAFPCVVQSYDSGHQTVDVQPQIKRPIQKQDGSTTYESYPVISNVPVAFPRAGQWFMSFPITTGDCIFVVCSERSLDEWRANGFETETSDLRTHVIDGAVAFPVNVYPTSSPIQNVSATKLVIGNDTTSRIYIDTNLINLYEENANQFVALGQKTEDRLSALEGKLNEFIGIYNGHVHGGVFAGASSTTTTPAVETTLTPGATVSAIHVKAS